MPELPKVEVFDPPMCCPTGVCDSSVDPALVQFAADLEWLKSKGIQVERWNLAQRPAAFAQNETIRRALHDAKGQGLPMILVDGALVAKGAYPTREQLAGWFGMEVGEDSRESSRATAGEHRMALTVLPTLPAQSDCGPGCGPAGCC
ncbi:MAG: arsenite efflux transporter metallochaperone ArsD [Actinomycetota bacterium]